MRVRAKVLGFANGSRQEPGAEFEIDGNDPKAFSEKWMEKLPEEPELTPEGRAVMPEAKAGKAPAKAKTAAVKKDKPTGETEVQLRQ